MTAAIFLRYTDNSFSPAASAAGSPCLLQIRPAGIEPAPPLYARLRYSPTELRALNGGSAAYLSNRLNCLNSCCMDIDDVDEDIQQEFRQLSLFDK